MPAHQRFDAFEIDFEFFKYLQFSFYDVEVKLGVEFRKKRFERRFAWKLFSILLPRET